MEVDRIMDYINEDLIDCGNQTPANIHPNTPPPGSPPDLHPWRVEDITDVHSLRSAEDPMPIPSMEDITQEARKLSGANGSTGNTEAEGDVAARVESMSWTKFHASGSGRAIEGGPLPTLTSLFGSSMKKIRDDFTAQKFETTIQDENDEVVLIRLVAQPWPAVNDSLLINSPILCPPSLPPDPPYSASLAYQPSFDHNDTPACSTSHSSPPPREFTSANAECEAPVAQAMGGRLFGERPEPQHPEVMGLARIAHHEGVASGSVFPSCSTEGYFPETPPGIQELRLPLPVAGVPPHVTGNFSEYSIAGPHSPVSRRTISGSVPLEVVPKRKSLKNASRGRATSWTQEANIKYFDPDSAARKFFRCEPPPHMDDSASQEDEGPEEIADCDIRFDPKGPSFICTCGQAFSRKNDVKRHFRLSSYHKAKRQSGGRRVGVKGVQCRHCGEVLSRPDACRRHEKVKACGKRAIRRPNGYIPVGEAT